MSDFLSKYKQTAAKIQKANNETSNTSLVIQEYTPPVIDDKPAAAKEIKSKGNLGKIREQAAAIRELLTAGAPAPYILYLSLKLNNELVNNDNWLADCLNSLVESYGSLEDLKTLEDEAAICGKLAEKQAGYINQLTNRRLTIQRMIDGLADVSNKLNHELLKVSDLIKGKEYHQPIKKPVEDPKPIPEIKDAGADPVNYEKLAGEDYNFLDDFNKLDRVAGSFEGRKHIVFDFEVFAKYWLVVCLIVEDKTLYRIDNTSDLRAFFESHINDVWLGYNNRNYDNYILIFALMGFDCDSIKGLNDFIISGKVEGGIVEKHRGFDYIAMLDQQQPNTRRDFNKLAYNLISFDIITTFTRQDDEAGKHGLKQLEAFTGRSIVESSISFDYAGDFNQQQKDEVFLYCKNDVVFTAYVAFKQFNKIKAHEALIDKYNIPPYNLISTDAQLSAKILQAKYKPNDDDYNLTFPTFADTKECIALKAWYTDPQNQHEGAQCKLELQEGLEATYGFGGGHAARPNYYDEGEFYHIDVNSFYPSLMRQYNLLSRGVEDPTIFYSMIDTRLAAKNKGDKLTADALKIVLNATNGAAKSSYRTPLTDRRQYYEVCIFGQLLLTKLACMLKDKCTIIQINTDAVDIKITDTPIEDLEPIIKQWENETGLTLEREKYIKIIQKSVNEYATINEKGIIKGHGGNLKNLSEFDNNMPIINKALRNKFFFGIDIDQTINESNELKDFQIIVKTTAKFENVLHGGRPLDHKVNRVFASTDPADGDLLQVSKRTGKAQKIGNMPPQCFIINDDINAAPIPAKLNRQWYIDKALDLYRSYLGIKE